MTHTEAYHDQSLTTTSKTLLEVCRSLVDCLPTFLLIVLVHCQCGNAFTQGTGDATYSSRSATCTMTSSLVS